MTDKITIRRVAKPDVLGRSESDPVDRLHAMADDALEHRYQTEVAREVEIAKAILGLRPR